jgi:uncharacterized integral membrane protein (TIGR00698 family)
MVVGRNVTHMAQPQAAPAAALALAKPSGRLPGLLLSMALASLAAYLGTKAPLIGGPVFGIVIGMVVRAFAPPGAAYKPGITFSSKQVLQLSIILLGAGLSFQQVVTTGADSLAVTLSTLAVCLGAAYLLGRALHMPAGQATLVGVGTAICGASAIAAVAPVIDANEEDVAYSISVIFAFNVVAVLLFPALGRLMGLGDHSFGLWAGTAVNDTSSVVAAAYSYSQQAGAYATVVKLTRSTLIIPIALALAAFRTVKARRAGGTGTQVKLRKIIPWFILGFLAASLLNTAGLLPAAAAARATTAGRFLIVVALTAVGLSADFRQMRRAGLKPLALGLMLWVLVAVTSLVVQFLTSQLA